MSSRWKGESCLRRPVLPLVLVATAALLAGCQKGTVAATGQQKPIVVTYSVLASVVTDLVGDGFNVVVSIPNGLDPHDWEPSARDIETMNKADFVVQNGLGLEGGLEKTFSQARASGVRFFTASDHIQIRTVGAGEGIPSGDPDQAPGAEDPHLWMDPITMKAVVMALASEMKAAFGVDLSPRANDLGKRLDELDAELRASIATIPADNRRLVTGHESLGYFAQRYGFKLVGAIIPSLSSQAEASASRLGQLKGLISANQVKVVFTELGTAPAVADALAREAGVKVVELTTHSVPQGGSYFSFMRGLTEEIVGNLR